jgi:hypothetical protein
MIISNALRTWLEDRPAQRRTQQAIDGFGRDWDLGPVQRRFDEAFAALPEQSAEAVADTARKLLADEAWVDALIAGLAGQLRADPLFEPPFRTMNSDIQSGLIVYEDPRVSIAVGVVDIARLAAKKSARRGATSVGFTGRVSVLKFVKADGTRISLWEAPAITPLFNAAEAGQCARTGERDLADGDILTIDGRRQSYVIEQARANLLVVQAEINLDQAPLSVEYDSAALTYIGCSANRDGASRIQMITTLLRKLGCAEAFEAVAGFIDHPDFFVRWHVMRELLGIDAETALPHLKRMAAHDPHPDARRAARSVLDRLDAPRPQKAA